MLDKELEVENIQANTNESTEQKGRVYELGFLLVPTIAEDEVAGVYGNLKDTVMGLGANVISEDMPKMITLAYEMLKVTQNVRSKFTSAYFGWVKFEMDAHQVLELKNKLDLDPTMLRYLIIKTVKENTIAAKRFVYKDTPRGNRKPYLAKKEGEAGEEAVPINKEEIDKEIDAMVAV